MSFGTGIKCRFPGSSSDLLIRFPWSKRSRDWYFSQCPQRFLCTVKFENQYFQGGYISGSQLGMILPLVTSGDIMDCHDCGRAPGICWAEARHAAEHPTVQCPPQRMISPQMSVVLRLRKPGLGHNQGLCSKYKRRTEVSLCH